MVKGEMRPPPSTMTAFRTVYDPDQPEEERREVASKFQHIKDMADSAKDSDNAYDIWGKAVEDSNEAFNDSESPIPRKALVD
ncbi:hypothetical protein NLI96_g6907 [Meripilus lineatus]|uniref:Uncharacterized protein n=1 Tax=Meripilus lineatus TaxID=2056292 RepID=A0AAD5YFH8_9APHY|nr:hypothetical protein NLI96_g6907 [Physisporinus lineatus]